MHAALVRVFEASEGRVGRFEAIFDPRDLCVARRVELLDRRLWLSCALPPLFHTEVLCATEPRHARGLCGRRLRHCVSGVVALQQLVREQELVLRIE